MDNNSVGVKLVFENSWEVCNKIGGIYTVLSTKAKTLQDLYPDKIIFVGPDVWTEASPSPYFKEGATPLDEWKTTVELPHGISVRTGRWDIPGNPLVVLVKFESMYAIKDKFYGDMWNLYGVDSLHAYGDYDEACAFSHASGIVIESICRFNGVDKGNYIAHFDEWTTGMGLLYIKHALPQVSTIFTTHATSIGRSICGNGKPLYDYLKGYNGDQMAGELNMQSKHSLEKTAAHQADCFTTVSEVTARECEQLLERRPDVVTPNGFEANFVPQRAKYTKARAAARLKMLEVASALTGVELDDDTFIVATSGRCEYRNKGIDLYLDSINRLRELNPARKVLAWVMVPAWVKDARTDLAYSLANGKRCQLYQPYSTHTLNNDNEDPIINRIRGIGFNNDNNSNVITIYVPCYLNGNDGIFNTTYYDLLIGMDATVFPSYYEPWGYTPLESVAFGVPTITTSLSGFGQWILSESENNFKASGVKVIERGDFNYDEVKENIAQSLNGLVQAAKSATKLIQTAAKKTAQEAAWQNFIKYYQQSFEIAISNAKARN
jgi:glycosyltransferase involved in cell wall biosynthesis